MVEWTKVSPPFCLFEWLRGLGNWMLNRISDKQWNLTMQRLHLKPLLWCYHRVIQPCIGHLFNSQSFLICVISNLRSTREWDVQQLHKWFASHNYCEWWCACNLKAYLCNFHFSSSSKDIPLVMTIQKESPDGTSHDGHGPRRPHLQFKNRK